MPCLFIARILGTCHYYILFSENPCFESPDHKREALNRFPATQKTGRPELELLVTVLNINPGKNETLMESCTLLKEYMQYVEKVRGHLSKYSLAKAVNLAVDECICEGIVAEFLSRNKAEAIAVSIYEYDEEKHLKNLFEEGKAEGILKGKAVRYSYLTIITVCYTTRLFSFNPTCLPGRSSSDPRHRDPRANPAAHRLLLRHRQ